MKKQDNKKYIVAIIIALIIGGAILVYGLLKYFAKEKRSNKRVIKKIRTTKKNK